MADPYAYTGETPSEIVGLPKGFFEGEDAYAANAEFEYIFGYMAAALLQAEKDNSYYMSDSALYTMLENFGPNLLNNIEELTATHSEETFSDVFQNLDADKRIGLMMFAFFSQEGSGFLLEQYPVFYPPEVSNSSTKSYGFLDPHESWQMGTRMHAYQAHPTADWHLENARSEGIHGIPWSTPESSWDEISYTTKDLAEGWTWEEIADYKDDYYGYSQRDFDGAEHTAFHIYNSLSCTFRYEAVIVNWFDTVGLFDIHEADADYYDYTLPDGSMGVGDKYHSLALTHDKAIDEGLLPGGTLGEWGDGSGLYMYQKLAENISFNSESCGAETLGSGAGASITAAWPWDPSEGQLDVEHIDPSTATITESADSEVSDFRTSYLLFTAPENSVWSITATTWQDMLTQQMYTRWRILEPYDGVTEKVYSEEDYYNFRISHAIDDLGPTLTYPDLPMKFLTKAQVYSGIPLDILSGLTSPSSDPSTGAASVTMTSPGPTGDY